MDAPALCGLVFVIHPRLGNVLDHRDYKFAIAGGIDLQVSPICQFLGL